VLALSIAITGTAYAAAPTLFSIADHTTPANIAKVSAAGALSTAGTVAGTVSAIPAAPKTPFSFPSASLGSPYWCFVTFASGSTGSAFYTTYSGYVVSGTFSPATTGGPTAKIDPATALRGETRAEASAQ
jgi:hypothetical protein